MIPLSRSDIVPARSHRVGQFFTGALLVLWVFVEVGHRYSSDSRSAALLEMLYHPGRPALSLVSSILIFQTTFSFVMNGLFIWVFLPHLFSWRRNILLLPLSFVAIALSGWVFFKIHPYLAIPIPVADAWVAFFLGAVMRSDVWGKVDTLVFGPRIFKVYEVPSYVLLFFWFFYVMIGNIFMPEPFSNLPMIYWMPFASFIQGFIYQSILFVKVPR